MGKMKTMLDDIYNTMQEAIVDPVNTMADGQLNLDFIEADIYIGLKDVYDVNTELFREAVEIVFDEEF